MIIENIELLKKIKISTMNDFFFASLEKDATFALRFEPPYMLFCGSDQRYSKRKTIIVKHKNHVKNL